MKRFYPAYAVIFFSVLFLVACPGVKAQGIYQLWGAMPYGGTDDAGVLFTTKYDGTGYSIKKQFTATNPGEAYDGNKPVVYNDKLYAVLYYGGLGSFGVIGEFNPATNVWVKKADLYSIGAKHAFGSMVLYNGKLYGVSHYGGANGGGVIFEYNPANAALSVVYHFTNATGEMCYGGMVVYNNRLYGTTVGGGANGSGVLFEFNPATAVYTKKIDFDQTAHGYVSGANMVVYNNKLWGTFGYGGIDNEGTLFSYDPATNVFSKKVNFSSTNLKYPEAQLTVLNNKLYGAAYNGGASVVYGGIFEYNPATNAIANVHDFSYTDAHLQVNLTTYNGKLYGTSVQGGQFGEGAIFWYNPATDEYHTDVSFFEAIGTNAYGGLTIYNGNFYGFTADGANYGRGSLFYFNPDENGYVSLVHFGGAGLRMPEGHLLQHNNKLYGTTTSGGANQRGGIYEYDIATGVYTMKISMATATGSTSLQGGLTACNNKFYGVTRQGGANSGGALYEYDPATNVFAKKHDFLQSTGSEPYGALTEYNGKLYGTCSYGSGNTAGNLFEYDPTTGNYAQRVVLGGNFGTRPSGKLALYNNKLYGTCTYGGADGNGTLFEYTPAGNAFAKKVDFNNIHGNSPRGGLTVFNGKMYGLTFSGGAVDSGTLYEYNPALVTLSKKIDLTQATGDWNINSLTVSHNKLIGLMNLGGANNEGTIIQYDPLTGSLVKKRDLDVETGRRSIANSLTAIPAPVAPGSPNSCINTQTININAANASEWIAFTDAEGRAVAEINANGNILGNTAVRFYVNGGNIRQNANGVFYLDRNITITPANQPATAVSIRLYIKRTEFESLKATAGSGVVAPSDLTVFRNADFCSSTMNASATKLTSVKTDWATDYVYATDVTSFSSFYFASNTHSALPVQLLTFKGTALPAANKLEWKATCTNGINFTIERSTDGVSYQPIGLVLATQQDCNLPFVFNDVNIAALRYYYRLYMKEDGGPALYSPVVILDRSAVTQNSMQLLPNPVVGSITQLKVTASQSGRATTTITDMAGKTIYTKQATVAPSINYLPVETSNLPAGIYLVIFDDGRMKQTVKMIKQ